MDYKQAVELHDLLFSCMEMFHEKFLYRFRKQNERFSPLKKNHVKIISSLYRFNGLTSTEIAKRLDIEKGSVTTLIDQLSELGLLMRDASPHDRRKSMIVLTDAGRLEMENLIKNDTQILTEIFRDIEAEDLQKFIDSLQYAVDFMNKL